MEKRAKNFKDGLWYRVAGLEKHGLFKNLKKIGFKKNVFVQADNKRGRPWVEDAIKDKDLKGQLK